MRNSRIFLLVCSVLSVTLLVSCEKTDAPRSSAPSQPVEQKLLVNFGSEAVLPPPSGDPAKGEPQGKLGGQCGPDITRNVLNCDIYNGLEHWKLSEVTILVTYSPYGEDDMRVFRVPVSLDPLTTQAASVRLGMRLPADGRWGWMFGPVQGHRVQ